MIAEEDVAGLLAEAQKKGMYLVNDDSTDALVAEFTRGVAEADALAAMTDPDTEPYKSKYKARELLDGLVNKLEATRTIATVEGQRGRVAEMDWRLASARVRLGAISWECEEPHNAQTDLELAMEYYEPRFVQAVDELVGEIVVAAGGDDEQAEKPKVPTSPPPPITTAAALRDRKPDAIKCLNMLGILWAGRGQVQKSFLYLIAANNLYSSDDKGAAEGVGKTASAAAIKSSSALESVYTHNLFYLAQAYGQSGDTLRSSEYCYLTLQRQLLGGLAAEGAGAAPALDWCRNCASIADFYKSLRHFRRCALALTSAETLLQTRVLATLPLLEAAPETYEQQELRRAAGDVAAELHRRWAELDMAIMKRAFDREMKRLHALEAGYEFEDEGPDEPLDDDKGTAAAATALTRTAPIETVFAFPPGSSSSGSGGSTSDSSKSSRSSSVAAATTEFFAGLAVTQVPFLCAGDVKDFETARLLFLRTAARLDKAKRHFVLDGFVTDHVTLLQHNSKLFHYLAIFEPEPKRKLAMEARRVDMLAPLLKTLNKAAYEGLHKQLSYELAEAHMSLLEIKLERLKAGAGPGVGGQGIDLRAVKRTDLAKCNAYGLASLAMFTNFLSYYARTDDRNARGNGVPFSEMPLETLAAVSFPDPDESLISAEELRPFLNAHFLSCRVLSKVLTPPDAPPQQRVLPMAACLQRYEWLLKHGPEICRRKDVDIDEIFGGELGIIAEMVHLLPSKIDRIFYRGESSIL